jgi:crotonobetainyl-CoA:carnitine CoA-transferase CaiB-like acyl-CoA transferase
VTAVLHGVRVLDFGRYIAGPYCAALLAEYGAEVIRVERRGGGEDRAVAPVAPSGDGALFLQMNRNKLSLTLDPMVDEGREIVRRLVATADVVVANLPPAALAAMRLDYASLRAVKPDVILTTVSAYGSAGPLSERLGFDGVGQAMCGAVYMGGEPGRPSRAAVSWVDFATALHAAFGTLMALMSRARTGAGQVVEAALLPTAVALNGVTLIEQALLQRDRQPTANRGQYSAPSNVFRTRDGWILCQVFGNAMFGRWGALMGEERWGTTGRPSAIAWGRGARNGPPPTRSQRSREPASRERRCSLRRKCWTIDRCRPPACSKRWSSPGWRVPSRCPAPPYGSRKRPGRSGGALRW